MEQTRKVWTVLTAVLVATICVLTFAATQTRADVKKPSVVNVAFISDMSGPYAAMTKSWAMGMKDAIEYVNDELNGVHGVPMKLIIRDTGGKVDAAVSNYMKLREMKPRPLFAGVVVSSEAEALKERAAEDQIPILCPAATSAIYPMAYNFAYFPLYVDQAGAFMDWLMDNWKKPRPPKIAFLCWDSTYGRAVFTDEVRNYAKKKGVEIVAEEVFGMRDVDVTTQLTRIKAKGADWVYSNSTASGPWTVAKGIKEMGYKVNMVTGCGSQATNTLAAAPPGLMDGCYVVHFLRSFSDVNNPMMKKVRKYFEKKKRSEKDWGLGMLGGFWFVDTYREAISRAIRKVGWEGLNGKAVKEAMETYKDFMPIDATVYTYTSTKHSPEKIYMGRVKGKYVMPVSDWMVCPDLRPAKFK